MSSQRLAFPDKGLSMAIHHIGMFIVKEINRLKIIQDVIGCNLRRGQPRLGSSPFKAGRMQICGNMMNPYVMNLCCKLIKQT